MEATTSGFAEWVTATARAMGYRSDAQLAAALGIEQSTISRWRRKNATPQIKHLVALAQLFKMRIDPLLGMSGHVPPELLSDAAPPAPPETVTPGERVILDAGLDEEQQELLLTYWRTRLNEERRRAKRLITLLQNTDVPDQNLISEELRAIFDTELTNHVIEVINDWLRLSHDQRIKRRKRKPSSPSSEEDTRAVLTKVNDVRVIRTGDTYQLALSMGEYISKEDAERTLAQLLPPDVLSAVRSADKEE